MPRNVARCCLRLVAAVSCLFWSHAATAHDYWMVPDMLYSEKAPQKLAVRLYVGDAFIAEEEKPHARDRTAKLLLVSGGGTKDLAGSAEDGQQPAISLPALSEGGHLVVLQRNQARVELEPAKFESYLKEEGLEHVIAERLRRNEAAKPGRERYARYMKALVQVGDKRDDVFGARIDELLSIRPLQNPVFVEIGKTLAVELRFRDKPLAGAKLEAMSRDGSGDVAHAAYVTNAEGIADIAIQRSGTWILRVTHMIRCEGCEDAEWESFWGSYVFGTVPRSGGDYLAPSMFLPSKDQPGAEPAASSSAGPKSVPPQAKGCTCEMTGGGASTPAVAGLALIGVFAARSGRRRSR